MEDKPKCSLHGYTELVQFKYRDQEDPHMFTKACAACFGMMVLEAVLAREPEPKTFIDR